MMSLELHGIVSYSDFKLQFDLSLKHNGVLGLFGSSGSGKSTLLRCVAGLTRPQNGFIQVGNNCWQDDQNNHFIPTYQRNIGFVFQDTRLFPHLNVMRNLTFGMQRTKTNAFNFKLDDIITLLGIQHLTDRMIDTLSGGEKQRVAIARALATSPEILLLDEPLSALDHARKLEIIPYLQKLNRSLTIPIIYVTHSLEEISTLTDELVLLDNGHIIANGPTEQLLTRTDLPLSHQDNACCIIRGTVSSIDSNFSLATVSFDGGELFLPSQSLSLNQTVQLRIAARDVSLSLVFPSQTSILNILPAQIFNISALNDSAYLISLRIGSHTILARVTRKSAHDLNLQINQSCYVQIKSMALLL